MDLQKGPVSVHWDQMCRDVIYLVPQSPASPFDRHTHRRFLVAKQNHHLTVPCFRGKYLSGLCVLLIEIVSQCNWLERETSMIFLILQMR